mmetsp:Transcript_16914/g.26031  ORF Transcript_16914/g.26031 Transcript_16914/m.26031 type:complete len:104 (-) Transcript_16914:722-1033(-)
MSQTFDIGLPSFLMDENNQLYVLIGFVLTFVMVPIAIILKMKEPNDPSEQYFENGIHKGSAVMMFKTLFETLDKNMKKKVRQISDDQFIEIMESSLEMAQLNA